MARYIPQRTCLGCRQAKEKRSLVRLVCTGDGEVEVDPSGKRPGRGAYLCPNPGCWQQGLRADRLGHALRIGVSPESMARLRIYATRFTSL